MEESAAREDSVPRVSAHPVICEETELSSKCRAGHYLVRWMGHVIPPDWMLVEKVTNEHKDLVEAYKNDRPWYELADEEAEKMLAKQEIAKEQTTKEPKAKSKNTKEKKTKQKEGRRLSGGSDEVTEKAEHIHEESNAPKLSRISCIMKLYSTNS